MTRFQATLAAAVGCAIVSAWPASLPRPVALWELQEAAGQPKLTSPDSLYDYALTDAYPQNPVGRVAGGVFGPWAANFTTGQRLAAPRDTVPAITADIAGPSATVTLMTWIRTASADPPESMIAGVWDENLRARQYAIFTNLAVCSYAKAYAHGLAAHISNCGGPTPGQRYCTTRACDPLPLPAHDWHCLANVYNGTHILAYLNGTFDDNGGDNPFFYPGGIFSPEMAGRPGAEFGVGANFVNYTPGGPRVQSNEYTGMLGGVAVWNVSLDAEQVAEACTLPPNFF